jgi:hypothetical protein
MITQRDLDIFQICPARWRLSKNSHKVQKENIYCQALKKTVFQMYSWLQEKDKFMTENQVRERWDKNFLDMGNRVDNASLAVPGWLSLFKYWEKYYLAEALMQPVGLNFEFTSNFYDVQYRVHIDLILSDKSGRYIYRQFGIDTVTSRQMYNSLGTKLEIISLEKDVGNPPTTKSYINLGTRTEETILNTSPAFIKQANSIISGVSAIIYMDAIYAAMDDRNCMGCEFNGTKKCWF